MRQIRQYIPTNEKLILHFNSDCDKSKAFGMYNLIRSYFSRPIIYNYSIRSAQKKTGIPASQWRAYVPLMVKFGLAEKTSNGHLKLKGGRKLEEEINGKSARHCCTIDTKGEKITRTKDMNRLLLLKIAEQAGRQLQYKNRFNVNKITEVGNVLSPGKANRNEIVGDSVQMSTTYLAKIIGKEKSTTQELINWWSKKGYINRIKSSKKMAQDENGDILTIPKKQQSEYVKQQLIQQFGHGYWWRKRFVLVQPDYFNFCSFPLW